MLRVAARDARVARTYRAALGPRLTDWTEAGRLSAAAGLVSAPEEEKRSRARMPHPPPLTPSTPPGLAREDDPGEEIRRRRLPIAQLFLPLLAAAMHPLQDLLLFLGGGYKSLEFLRDK